MKKFILILVVLSVVSMFSMTTVMADTTSLVVQDFTGMTSGNVGDYYTTWVDGAQPTFSVVANRHDDSPALKFVPKFVPGGQGWTGVYALFAKKDFTGANKVSLYFENNNLAAYGCQVYLMDSNAVQVTAVDGWPIYYKGISDEGDVDYEGVVAYGGFYVAAGFQGTIEIDISGLDWATAGLDITDMMQIGFGFDSAATNGGEYIVDDIKIMGTGLNDGTSSAASSIAASSAVSVVDDVQTGDKGTPLFIYAFVAISCIAVLVSRKTISSRTSKR